MKTGLVSITFEKLSPLEIVDLIKRAGLEGIEWGVRKMDIERKNAEAALQEAIVSFLFNY